MPFYRIFTIFEAARPRCAPQKRDKVGATSDGATTKWGDIWYVAPKLLHLHCCAREYDASTRTY